VGKVKNKIVQKQKIPPNRSQKEKALKTFGRNEVRFSYIFAYKISHVMHLCSGWSFEVHVRDGSQNTTTL